MSPDAESHGPTETWTLVVCPECGWWEADHGDVPIWCPDDHRPEVELESVVVARRERVCQELAEAIKAEGLRRSDGIVPLDGWEDAAEFVACFGVCDRCWGTGHVLDEDEIDGPLGPGQLIVTKPCPACAEFVERFGKADR